MRKRGGARERRSGILRSGSALIGRNPVAIGAVTGFFVIFAFISANALWYQPHAHPGPLFETRPHHFVPKPVETKLTLPETTAAIVPVAPRRDDGPAAGHSGDPTLFRVQETLAELRLYDGEPDGIQGPQTREAVMQYQRVVGLEQTGTVDEELLRHLGLRQAETPVPAPRPAASPATTPQLAAGDPMVMQIQAALKAFGNAHIEVDGIAGKQTEAAIREFQALFGLEVDGRPDEGLLKKMRDLGMVE